MYFLEDVTDWSQLIFDRCMIWKWRQFSGLRAIFPLICMYICNPVSRLVQYEVHYVPQRVNRWINAWVDLWGCNLLKCFWEVNNAKGGRNRVAGWEDIRVFILSYFILTNHCHTSGNQSSHHSLNRSDISSALLHTWHAHCQKLPSP